MFGIAQLIKVHLDLWPWLTFRGHFKATNVKIAYIVFMVRDKHNGYYETLLGSRDIGRSESAKKLTLDDLEEVISRSRRLKWPVSSKRLLLGPGCLWTKMFGIAQLIKVHLDLWPWFTFTGHFKIIHKFDIGWHSRGYFKVTKVKKCMWRLLSESSRLPSDTYFKSMTFDLKIDWFGAMSRPSQQQLGFLFPFNFSFISSVRAPWIKTPIRLSLLSFLCANGDAQQAANTYKLVLQPEVEVQKSVLNKCIFSIMNVYISRI